MNCDIDKLTDDSLDPILMVNSLTEIQLLGANQSLLLLLRDGV